MAEKRMSIWGVGPTLISSTVIYTGLIAYINSRYRLSFPISIIPDVVLFISGAILMVIGIIIWFLSIRTIMRDFEKGILFTKGVYSYARHPLYSAFILFLVPGAMLLTKSWLLLTVPVFMFIVFKLIIKEEEEYLEQQFGAQYLAYKQNTITTAQAVLFYSQNDNVVKPNLKRGERNENIITTIKLWGKT